MKNRNLILTGIALCSFAVGGVIGNALKSHSLPEARRAAEKAAADKCRADVLNEYGFITDEDGAHCDWVGKFRVLHDLTYGEKSHG